VIGIFYAVSCILPFVTNNLIMSGHSKWSTIKRAKDAKDAKRGNIFTKHAKNIAIAARAGGDPEMNHTLKAAIDKAKKDNMPNSNIDNAVKKGTGELKGAAEILEITYEGYGPEGIAVIVECHTDNRQRTVASVRHIFSKNNGNMGENGCVSYMFKRHGLIVFENPQNAEEIEMAAIELGCDDVSLEEGVLEIVTPADKLHEIAISLEEKGHIPTSKDLELIPDNYIKISEDKLPTVLKLLEALEEDDDVSKVTSNFDL